MSFKITPCLKNFKLDDNNVCDLCQKRILLEHEMDECTDDKICVQTTSDRLNGSYLTHPVRVIRMAILLVFGGTLFTFSGIAQDTIVNTTATEAQSNYQEEVIQIRGRLVGESDGLELPFAKVLIYGTQIGAYSDFDGIFSLRIKSYEYSPPLTIRISYMGYEEVVIELNKIYQPGDVVDLGEIILKEDHGGIIVGIVIEEPVFNDFKDPNSHRGTTFKREDIERSPYRE